MELLKVGPGAASSAGSREPLAAAHCALALVPATGDLPLHTRVGLHVGDCDTRGEQPTGINVHLAARVMSTAAGDTVLASESSWMGRAWSSSRSGLAV